MGNLAFIERLRPVPFLTGAVRFIGADMEDENARAQRTEAYEGLTLPGAVEVIGPNFDYKKNSVLFDETFLSKDEFKELIPLCNVFTDNGDLIQSCNLYNEGDKFITSDAMKVTMTEGKLVLDLDVPRNKILIACFLKDKRFKDNRVETRGNSGSQIYSISFQSQLETNRITAAKAEMDVVTYIKDMSSRKKLLTLCKILDLRPIADASDDTIKTSIYEKIKRGTMVGNVSSAKFLVGYAALPEAELKYWDVFIDARKALILHTNEDRMFVFAGQILGRYENDAVSYLMEPQNADIFGKIRDAVNKKKRRGELNEDRSLGLEESGVVPNPPIRPIE